jgi:hypothetical protein
MLAHEKVIMMWFNSSKISHKDQKITEITSHRITEIIVMDITWICKHPVARCSCKSHGAASM